MLSFEVEINSGLLGSVRSCGTGNWALCHIGLIVDGQSGLCFSTL